MLRTKEALIILLVWWSPFVRVAVGIKCSGIAQAFSECANGGWVEPTLWSPCCKAMSGLSLVAKSSIYEKQDACRCIMEIIASSSPNFSAIASFPGFCGVSLGFTIQPDLDCDSII